MIDEVTTNKTDFFREPAHFQFLTSDVLPALVQDREIYGFKQTDDLERRMLERRRTIYNSDGRKGLYGRPRRPSISDHRNRYLPPDARKGCKAVYETEKTIPIPPPIKKKFLLRSKNPASGIARIVPEIRSCVAFRRLNFMDYDFGFREQIDIIFCRNVIIYFDKTIQEKLLRKFCQCMKKGGYIFMGHSETLFGMDLPLEQVSPTVYRKCK